MPKAFADCVRKGGKVRTVTMPGEKYVHVCTIGGESHYGHVKTKKDKKK